MKKATLEYKSDKFELSIPSWMVTIIVVTPIVIAGMIVGAKVVHEFNDNWQVDIQ